MGVHIAGEGGARRAGDRGTRRWTAEAGRLVVALVGIHRAVESGRIHPRVGTRKTIAGRASAPVARDDDGRAQDARDERSPPPSDDVQSSPHGSRSVLRGRCQSSHRRPATSRWPRTTVRRSACTAVDGVSAARVPAITAIDARAIARLPIVRSGFLRARHLHGFDAAVLVHDAHAVDEGGPFDDPGCRCKARRRR